VLDASPNARPFSGRSRTSASFPGPEAVSHSPAANRQQFRDHYNAQIVDLKRKGLSATGSFLDHLAGDRTRLEKMNDAGDDAAAKAKQLQKEANEKKAAAEKAKEKADKARAKASERRARANEAKRKEHA
jgi:Skp family chaperone for outer membrane proteins